MDYLSCAIVDDEPLAIKLIESFISHTPFLKLVGSYTNSVLASSELKVNPVNLLFLDIEMPDLDGMELAQMVPSETRIIFTTAYKEFAFDSYRVNAIDFLLKPIHYHKFLDAVNKARQWFDLKERAANPLCENAGIRHTQQEEIFIKVDSLLQRIDLNRLLYVMGMKDYMVFVLVPDNPHEKEKTLLSHITMGSVETLLPNDRFLRVNRSYIVALDKIKSVDKNNCIYIGHEIIRVTDAYKAAFQEYLSKRMQ
jgi:DNA-binding LytR/AlgR family response regulator